MVSSAAIGSDPAAWSLRDALTAGAAPRGDQAAGSDPIAALETIHRITKLR